MDDIEKEKESGKMKERIILALLGNEESIKKFMKALSDEELLLVKKILAMEE